MLLATGLQLFLVSYDSITSEFFNYNPIEFSIPLVRELMRPDSNHKCQSSVFVPLH